eukprot:g28414.t1
MREALERYVATAVMRGKRSRSFCFEHDTPTTSTRSSNGSHHERVLRAARTQRWETRRWRQVPQPSVSGGEELHSSLERLLELAVQWNCEKHYVTIARRLVATCGFPKAARFILQHFCNDWSEKEVETAPLMRWLVATFIDSLKPLGVVGSRAEPASNEPKTLRRLDLNELSPGSIRWNKAEMQLQTFEVSSLAHLFIWLVENMAPESVTDVLWLCLDYPAHGALAAASVCRHAAELYQLQGSGWSTMVGNRLFKRANRFEAMAIRLLEGLDRVDPLEYVFRCSWRWGNHHLISLAHHLECKEFVSQHFYNSAVDLLWVTPTPFAVFAFDKDDQRRQANKVMEPYPETLGHEDASRSFPVIFLRLFQQLFNPSSSRHQLSLRDLSSIPRVKALTHGGSRVTFVLLYSHFVLFSTGYEAWLLSLVLFVWGISLSLIEALQLQAKGSIGQYMNIWNGLDVLLIFTLLIGLILWWCLVPWALSEQTVNSVHALTLGGRSQFNGGGSTGNLLPCYVRLLQIFELSEYFGTLLFTVFGMAQDTTQFLVLLGIISLGFSCSLTPILYPTHQARWSQGDVNLEGTEENLPWSLKICVSFLQYLLSLASNVLLVNLLIAMLNDTYVANKDSSKREWAFNRVDAVLEFASPEAHILPPPLDILVSIRHLCGAKKPVSRKEGPHMVRLYHTGIRFPFEFETTMKDDMMMKDAAHCCVLASVVPLGPHEVQITIDVNGGDIQAADSSLLAWEDVSMPPDEVNAVEKKCHSAVLIYRNVVLSKPLRFTFGGKGSGYETIRVVETNQKVSLAVDEITRLSKNIADLTKQMQLQVERTNALQEEIRQLKGHGRRPSVDRPWDDETFVERDLEEFPRRGTVGPEREYRKRLRFEKKRGQRAELRGRQAAERVERIEAFRKILEEEGLEPSQIRRTRLFRDASLPQRMPWMEKEETKLLGESP